MDEFRHLYSKSQQILDSLDIVQIVKYSLQLCSYFNDETDFSTFIDIHSKVLNFLSRLNHILSKEDFFTKEQLEDGFFKSQSSNLLIPRVYISFFFVIALRDENYISLVLQTAEMIGPPMKNMSVRFAFASFLPHDLKIYSDFIKKNFAEMVYYYPILTNANDELKGHAIGWIITNISYVQNNEESKKLIDFFINEAFKIGDQKLSDNVFYAAICSLPSEQYKNYYDRISNFINTRDESTEKLKTINAMIKETNDIGELFDFLITLKIDQSWKDKVLTKALEVQDIETVKKCAIKWPEEQILQPILDLIQIDSFMEMMPTPEHNSPFTIKMISDYSEEMSKEQIRHLISNEFSDRSDEMDDALLIIADYGFDICKFVFSKPFEFGTKEMVELSLNGVKNKEDIDDFVERSQLNDAEKNEIYQKFLPNDHPFIKELLLKQEKENNNKLKEDYLLPISERISLYIEMLLDNTEKGNDTQELRKIIKKTIESININYSNFLITNPDVIDKWKEIFTNNKEKYGEIADLILEL